MSIRKIFSLIIAVLALTNVARSEPVHGIAMHGRPALDFGFKHLPYVNPDAPKGGDITYGVLGTFDSVNPFILKSMRTNARGSWDHQFGKLVFESLLFRSMDEPFTMYGWLAKAVEWPDDRSWIEFTIDERARWSDGVPVTVDDVIFTYELFAEKARPPYSSRMDRIERIEDRGQNRVRFVFNEKADREFPMIISLTPVLPKHATNLDTFDQSSLNPMIGSGAYRMGRIEPGKYITYERRDDYWAKNLPTRKGFANFDRVKVEYYRSSNSLFEAFKKGLVDVLPENDPSAWRRDFTFPAVAAGDVIKDEFKTGKPAPMLGFVFNTRRPLFSDVRVRRALAMLFDFEWTNRNLFFDAYERTASFWHGSELSSSGMPASAEELEILGDDINKIQADVLDGTWQPAITDGTGNDRKVMRQAYDLLRKAGFKRDGDRLVRATDGQVLSFEILTRSSREEKMALSYRRVLEKLGIEISIRSVDDAQYQQRTQTFDYDMVVRTYAASLSPGIEQIWRWGSRSREVEGSFNFAGAADPAIDRLIDILVKARTREAFIAAVRAYDRLLLSGHYLVPLYHIQEQWVARWDRIQPPRETPLYGYQFEAWWHESGTQNTDLNTQ